MASIGPDNPAHPDNRRRSSACRLCWHDVRDHNIIEGCKHCKCAATPGEAEPLNNREADKQIIGPHAFKEMWQDPKKCGARKQFHETWHYCLLEPDHENPMHESGTKGWPKHKASAAGIRPDYYGGPDNPYEVIKVIHAWGLGFDLGSVAKYIARAGKKDPAKGIEDLEKAKTYIDFAIAEMKKGQK